MVLKRFTNNVDGTIPVPALLYEDEVLLSSQDGVGIYDGPQKAPHHQAGVLHATTHRLFYIDNAHSFSRSFFLDLSHIARTEYYGGLFTSSPKVTLYLNSLPFAAQHVTGTESGTTELSPAVSTTSTFIPVEFWECEVCSNRNPIGLTSSTSLICALCGVPRASVKAPINIPSRSVQSSSHPSVSTSLPTSSLNLSNLSVSASLSPSPPVPLASPTASDSIACSACTFLNSPLLRQCEICGTLLPHKPSHLPAKSAPTSRSATPLPDEDSDDDDDAPEKRMIRLSFRKGGDKNFYNVLRRSLLGKAWESKAVESESSAAGSSSRPLGRSGINGILRSVETTAATSQSNMENALADLEALMVKWKDMVKLAQDLNERLSAASTPAGAQSLLSGASPGPVSTQAVEPEEATFIRSSLAQLGLQMANAPVTQDMVRDERNWYEELARELAGVLEGHGGRGGGEGIIRKRGIVALDEVWGGWNRARGVALIPPATFLQVLPHLPSFTHPTIQMRTFAASGLSVLHTPPFGSAAFASRLVGLLTLGPRTTVEIAQEEDLPIGLTQEMVDEVEREGEICRDDGGSGVAIFSSSHVNIQSPVRAESTGVGWTATANNGGGEVRWWINVFREYVWDGQV